MHARADLGSALLGSLAGIGDKFICMAELERAIAQVRAGIRTQIDLSPTSIWIGDAGATQLRPQTVGLKTYNILQHPTVLSTQARALLPYLLS